MRNGNNSKRALTVSTEEKLMKGEMRL